MPKLNQRGVVHFLLPLILLLGIIAGVWLITNGNPLKLFSKAGGGPIWFTDVNGNTLPVKNNIPQTTSAKVRIELYSTLGPPLKSISSPVSFKPLVSSVYAQENTTCPGGCADSQGSGANGLKCDPQSWIRKDYTQCTNTGTYYYCYSLCSKPSTSPPVQNTKSCPGGTTACGGSSYDNLGSCSTAWSYPGNPDWNDWCLKNAGGADAYCYSCSVPPPASAPTPTTPKCPGSCGNSDRSGLGECKGGWEYTPKYNAACGAQKYCYVCDNQIQNPTPPIPSSIPQPPDTPPVGQPPPPPDIPVPQPTNPPEPTPKVRYTTSYRIAENPTDLAQALWFDYTEEPTIVNKYSGGVYEFKDQTLGIKFIWVEFKANDGSIDRRSAQIEIVANPVSAPITNPQAKRVFVTSSKYDGNLGGLSGADAKCQQRANVSNLGGNWKAWLSDNQSSAANRLSHSTVPYKQLNNVVIANNWNDLTDGSLQNLPTMTELSTNYYGTVWTGTNSNGTAPIQTGQASHCKGWTTDSSSEKELNLGAAGNNQVYYYWTYIDINLLPLSSFQCNNNYALYCFEQ